MHFKMDTLVKVLNLMKVEDWVISLDLTDAYLHVPIFQKSRKFLRICVQDVCFQWKALRFGPAFAPRASTKILTVVAAYHRAKNIKMVVYLDN